MGQSNQKDELNRDHKLTDIVIFLRATNYCSKYFWKSFAATITIHYICDLLTWYLFLRRHKIWPGRSYCLSINRYIFLQGQKHRRKKPHTFPNTKTHTLFWVLSLKHNDDFSDNRIMCNKKKCYAWRLHTVTYALCIEIYTENWKESGNVFTMYHVPCTMYVVCIYAGTFCRMSVPRI